MEGEPCLRPVPPCGLAGHARQTCTHTDTRAHARGGGGRPAGAGGRGRCPEGCVPGESGLRDTALVPRGRARQGPRGGLRRPPAGGSRAAPPVGSDAVAFPPTSPPRWSRRPDCGGGSGRGAPRPRRAASPSCCTQPCPLRQLSGGSTRAAQFPGARFPATARARRSLRGAPPLVRVQNAAGSGCDAARPGRVRGGREMAHTACGVSGTPGGPRPLSGPQFPCP